MHPDAVVGRLRRDRPARRLLQPGAVSEDPHGPWLRSIAAVGFLAAGLIHLAQVALHLAEGLVFAGFFALVGGLQVGAAVALVRARRPRWYWLGSAGSAATVAIWLLSRSLGLPFGAEPGSPEAIGTADAAASLLEGITVVALLLWLPGGARNRAGVAYAAGGAGITVMGLLWIAARASGAFDPDVRLTGFPPELADRAVVVLVVASLAMLAVLGASPAGGARRRPLLRGLLILTALSAGALTVLTLPARGGQNAGCEYGPLAEVSGLSHAEPPEPVKIDPGQTGDVAVLQLAVCGSEPVMVMAAEPLNTRGPAEVLVGFAVRDYVRRLDLGLEQPASEVGDRATVGELLAGTAGELIRPGETRELVARIRGSGGGPYELNSIRLRLLGSGGETRMTFASFLRVCPASCPPEE